MKSGVNFLVVKDHAQKGEAVYYCGTDELEARKKYKGLEGLNRTILKADVLVQEILNVPFIMKYDVLEVIK